MQSNFKKFKGLDAFYMAEVKPLMMENEHNRQKVVSRLKRVISGIFSASIICIVSSFSLIDSPDTARGAAFIAGFLGLFLAGIAYSLLTKPLQHQAKTILAGRLAGFFGWTFEVKEFTPLSTAEFRRLRLLPISGRIEKFEDQISGAVGAINFMMHELKLITKGKNSDTVHFEGQVMALDYPRKFLGETIVLRANTIKNKLFKPKVKGIKKVGLVDPYFEKIFDVFSTDQVEGRYLLPPDFMQRILDLESSVDGEEIRFGFSKGKLLIAIKTENRFEPGGVFKPYDDDAPAQKIMTELTALKALIANITS